METRACDSHRFKKPCCRNGINGFFASKFRIIHFACMERERERRASCFVCLCVSEREGGSDSDRERELKA